MLPLFGDYNIIQERFFHTEKIGEYSLDNIQKACQYFGNPERAFQSIHIAGTNGKGSVSRMIFQILKDARKKVGVFTSPHIIDIRERFETHTGRISKEDFVKYARKIIEYESDLSYFERCTLLAFLYFRDQGVEYGVIEVGLGGRLDATNVITPVITAITSIGYDHTEFLGETLEKIASEKGGIIKSDIPVVLYSKNPVLERIAHEKHANVITPMNEKLTTNLIGEHQQRNAKIAYTIARYLGIDDLVIRRALMQVDHPGRLEYLTSNLLIDGAHNAEGLIMLAKYLKSISKDFEEIVYSYGLKTGKNAHLVLEIFKNVNDWHLIRGKNPLLADVEVLKKEIEKTKKTVGIWTADEIIAQSKLHKKTLFVVFGSLYLIGDFYKS